MDSRKLDLPCVKCGSSHSFEIDFDTLNDLQKAGKEPIVSQFYCPDSAWMYRVFNFSLDTRVGFLNNDSIKETHSDIISGLERDWGVSNFAGKLERFKKLNLSLMGIPEEYSNLLWDVVSSYCCGRYYSTMTSAGALGERILNRLIIKTRDYFKTSPHYKKLYRKSSFDQWELPIQALSEWGMIDEDLSEAFQQLKQFRNDSIHYNSRYDFELNSHDALVALAKIIDQQFNYIRRKDLLWVFDVPGEILVRSEKEDDPFVREFILPHCALITPYCEPTANPPVSAKNVPRKPLTDEQFIELRKERNKAS